MSFEELLAETITRRVRVKLLSPGEIIQRLASHYEALREAISWTLKSDREIGYFILDDWSLWGPIYGGYFRVPMGIPPSNAVGAFHTHPRARQNIPSIEDLGYISDHNLYFGCVGSSSDMPVFLDKGYFIFCYTFDEKAEVDSKHVGKFRYDSKFF